MSAPTRNAPARATNAPVREGQRAIAVIRGEEIPVRVDDDGYLIAVRRIVRLNYGTELYSATGRPTADDKVMPYQPGYMKLVDAMGGQLGCPPAIRNPETGKMEANPQVETYPGTGIIRFVKAAAVCIVPNPQTGQLVASTQTIVVDAEHELRQALLKINREECVRILSDEDVAEEKAAGKLKGWAVFPLTPPYANICANMAQGGVREVLQTFQNLSKTIRQRACSKAERLVCDHNPVTRRTWAFGELGTPLNDEGQRCGPLFMDVPVVAWVQEHDRRRLQRIINQLAQTGASDAVAQMVDGGVMDAEFDEAEQEMDNDGFMAEPRALPDRSASRAIDQSELDAMQQAPGREAAKRLYSGDAKPLDLSERTPGEAIRDELARQGRVPAPEQRAVPTATPEPTEELVGETNAGRIRSLIKDLGDLDRDGLDLVLKDCSATAADDFASWPVADGRALGAKLRAAIRKAKAKGSGEE